MGEIRQHAGWSDESVERMLRTLSGPRWWVGILLIAAFLSLFKLGSSGEGKFFIEFGFSTITAVLIALIWLPGLLRAIALMGFTVKTEGTEVSTPGLLALVPKMVAALDAAESRLPEGDQLRQIVQETRQEGEIVLASSAPSSEQSREQLAYLAQNYENIRRIMEVGPKRTSEMMTIAAQVWALAERANFSPSELRDLFMNGKEGNRIVALQLLREIPHPACFDIILQAISDPRSAFEQSAALRAAERMLSSLNGEQKRQLAAVIKDQRSGGPGKWITEKERDRWSISTRLLDAMGCSN
jgi:hypothetical protein